MKERLMPSLKTSFITQVALLTAALNNSDFIGRAKAMENKMPRINPHSSYIKQDEQLRAQLRWLKLNGFKDAREAQEAGH